METAAISDPGFGGHLATGIAAMNASAHAGRGFLASMHPGTLGDQQKFESALAAFLVAAGTNHFFGAGSWTCNHTSREGVTWWPEYDRPLGEPLGPATFLPSATATAGASGGQVLVRSFAHGVQAQFDLETGQGKVSWG